MSIFKSREVPFTLDQGAFSVEADVAKIYTDNPYLRAAAFKCGNAIVNYAISAAPGLFNDGNSATLTTNDIALTLMSIANHEIQIPENVRGAVQQKGGKIPTQDDIQELAGLFHAPGTTYDLQKKIVTPSENTEV